MLRRMDSGTALKGTDQMPEDQPNPSQPGKRLARVSILCGLAGPFTCGLGSLAGIVLGSLAIVRNRRHGRDPRVEKTAVAGILTAVICLPFSLLVAIQVLARLRS